MKTINLDHTHIRIIVLILAAATVLIMAHILIKAVDEAFFQKISKNLLPFNNTDFEMFDGKCCKSIAFQLENHNCADTEFGDLSRECAIFILKGLAQDMKNNENLSEYFLRKNKKD